MKINAKGLHYRELNNKIREAFAKGENNIILDNVNGQRYIASGINTNSEIVINGIPGNDLGIFMDGPKIFVNNNCQDGTGNTMNSGKIVINGDAGDILGYAMRGGKIFVKGNVGYRVGINMKEYKENKPVIVIGGSAEDFLGEYMAGGIIIMLNLNGDFDGDYLGTGMHNGAIYVNGGIEESSLGIEVGISEPNKNDKEIINSLLREFCIDVGVEHDKIKKNFIKLAPKTHRPYGQIYSY